MAQWDSNSQPKDDPYAISLDNSKIHRANGVNTLSRLLRHAWAHGGPILLNPMGPHREFSGSEVISEGHNKDINHLVKLIKTNLSSKSSQHSKREVEPYWFACPEVKVQDHSG